MAEIIRILLEKLSLKVVSILLIVFCAFFWGFTHWIAKSGEPVSVFWGMVNYTKSQNITKPSTPNKKNDKNNFNSS